MRKAMVLWIAGLLTLVPGATYYLLFAAPRGQYALLIVLILFWVFGYWSVVGPLLVALRVRSVVRSILAARSKSELVAMLRSAETRDAVVEAIAAENRIPRFLAARVYALLVSHQNGRAAER